MYIFPATRFVSNGLYEQIQHVRSESREVEAAYYEPYAHRIAEELCDVIHSAETALRIMAARYGINVEVMQAAVIEKNRTRGYYETMTETSQPVGLHSTEGGTVLPASVLHLDRKESSSNSPKGAGI